MVWSLYEKGGEFLKPLKFSNGKTQDDVVKEVLDAIEQGHKIIFIHGICGTGKSAISLHLAKELGKTSVIVPGKNLQNQYKKDYEKDKYILGNDGKKLKISVITGRSNHNCPFVKNNNKALPKIKKEVNAKLNNIFEFDEKEKKAKERKDTSANKWDLPCKIEIKEKNWRKLKKYIRKNDNTDPGKFSEVRDVTRASVAGACPYWSPVLPSKYELKNFSDSQKKSYEGLNDTKFIIHNGEPGCGFYKQFNSYLNSDVIVFNSMKYLLESALDRKPLTEIEIIDECDKFLDSFSNTRTINIERLQNALIYAVGFEGDFDKSIKEISEIVKQLKRNNRVQKAAETGEIIPIRETGIYDLIRFFLNNQAFLNEIEEESYLFDVEETSKMFEGLLDETYVTFTKKDNSLIVSIVTINLEKRFKDLRDKNKLFVLMSGTLHSKRVLREIFGIKDFKIIKAETKNQGQIEVKRTGLEKNCKYSNFKNGLVTRKSYLQSLNECIKQSKKPALVHINAYSDLPNEKEIELYGLNKLITRSELRETQFRDKNGKIIMDFKKGNLDVLFSTRASRGIDFPGEQCNSIIFTKYPNPNVKDAFWKILHKTRPQHYWDFYNDKARRELWQKVYRGLRFEEDHVYLLSPDSRVLKAFENSEN